MKKKQYEKPTVEKISFSLNDALMDDGELPGFDGNSQGTSKEDPFSLKDAYQLR